MHSVVLLVVLSLFRCTGFAQVNCYYAQDQLMSQDYTPCGQPLDGLQTACCHLGDYCLALGACYSSATNMTYVGGCTDPAFEDASCAGQKCQKTSPIQGIGTCNNNWVCCTGVEQQGTEPTLAVPDSCPCESDVQTFVMGNSSIDTTASLSNQLGGPIVLYASGGSTVVDSGPIASVIVVTMTAGTEGTGLTTPTTSLPPPITSPPSSSSRDTWTSLFQSTLAAGNTSPSISAFSSLTDSSGPSSSSSIPYATPSSSIDVSSTRLGEEIGLSIGIPLCLLLSGLLVRNIYWRRGHFFRRGSPSESSPKELKSSQPIYIQSSPVKAPTTQRQELSGWQAPELMDSTNKF